MDELLALCADGETFVADEVGKVEDLVVISPEVVHVLGELDEELPLVAQLEDHLHFV